MFKAREALVDSAEALNELINNLEDARNQKKGGSKKTTNTINKTSIAVDSWKFNEWDYGKPKIKLPIDARGLFILPEEKKIVVRGYDKFFNVNEVNDTRLGNLESFTSGPYELTLKENGCIIFISGLENGELVVCSKHSTGQRDDLTRNHAMHGESRLLKQLKSMNKSPSDLAKLLFDMNVTAVAEYCDDDFEEHVLPYSKDDAGLYLHGLNFNTIKFNTYDMKSVNEFAEDWGFKKIEYFHINSFTDLWNFLQECSKTGKYNNKEVEGFVIRCKKDGDDFFFKYKFEEPYLLYRHFREITKKYIRNEKSVSLTMPSIKRNIYISLKYLEFIDKTFKNDDTWANKYMDGHGIIKLRQLFIEDFHQGGGMDLLKFSEMDEKMNNLSITEYKYVILPVATIGCGKTTVFQTLSNLFDWPHIQNDNISNSANKNKLVEMGLDALIKNDVILLDRNNHQFRERKQLYDSFLSLKDRCFSSNVGIKFIVVNFIDESISQDELWEITFQRIKMRGDNHQCIKVIAGEELATNIMKGFINRFQPLDISKEPDSLFDLAINLKLSDGSLKNANVICQTIHNSFPDLIKNIPSDSEFKNSFQAALDYKPSFTKIFNNNKSEKKDKKKKISYFGISIFKDPLIEFINNIATSNQFWNQLVDNNRVQEEFHVTLGHVFSTKNNPANSEKWNNMNKIFNVDSSIFGKERKAKLDFFADVKLVNLILSEKELVCVEVELVKVYTKDGEEISIVCLNDHLHITIGTAGPDIKPVRSNAVLNDLYFERAFIAENTLVDLNGKSIEVLKFSSDAIFYRQQILAYL